MSSLQRIEMDHHRSSESRVGRDGDDHLDPLGPDAQPAGDRVAGQAAELEPAAADRCVVPWSSPTTSISAPARASSFGPRTTPSTDVNRPGSTTSGTSTRGAMTSGRSRRTAARRMNDGRGTAPSAVHSSGARGSGDDVEVGGPEGGEGEVHQQLARDGGVVRPGRHEVAEPELERRARRAARRRTWRDLEQIRAHAVTGSCVPRRLQREGRGRIHRRDPRTKETFVLSCHLVPPWLQCPHSTTRSGPRNTPTFVPSARLDQPLPTSASSRSAIRSEMAAMVRLGFGPTDPGMTDPSATYSPS